MDCGPVSKVPLTSGMKTHPALRFLVLGVALLVPAAGQWERVLISGKGERRDVPEPHPLSYFTDNPFLRDDEDELCGACTPEGKAKSAEKYSVQTRTQPVGVLAGFHIVDILYQMSPLNDPTVAVPGDRADWKFILVQVGPDRYREIFHLQWPSRTLSHIIRSGSERVLVSMDPDGGNGGGCSEGYWWFDQAGPHALDFSRMETAIKNAVPHDTRFRMSCSNLDLASERISSWVQKSNFSCMACDFVGEVTARFRLKGPIAEPVAVQFKAGDPRE